MTNSVPRHPDMKISISIAIVFSALVLQNLYYSSGSPYISSNLFIVLTALISGGSLYVILFQSRSEYLDLFIVIVTSFFLNSVYWYFSEGFPYIPPLDAIYHWKVSNTIIESGHLATQVTDFGMESTYSIFPGFHLFASISSIVTGVDSITFIKLSPWIYSLFPVLMYMGCRKLQLSTQISSIASFIAIFLPKYYPFPSYNRFALIYVVLLGYLLVDITLARKRGLIVLCALGMMAIGMTHHITDYVVLVFLVFLLVFNKINERFTFVSRWLRLPRERSIPVGVILLLITIGALFPIYGTYGLFGVHMATLAKYLSPTYSPEEFRLSIMEFYSGSEQTYVLSTLLISLLTGCIGLVLYLRSRSKSSILPLAIVGFIGLTMSAALPFANINPNTVHYVQYRGVYVVFLALAPFIAYFLSRFMSWSRSWKLGGMRFAKVLTVVFLAALAIASVDLLPREYIYFSQEKSTGSLYEAREYSQTMYSGLLWYKSNVNNAGHAIGDVPLVRLGDGMLSIDIELYWRLYNVTIDVNDTLSKLRKAQVEYILIDDLVFSYVEQPEFGRFIGPMERQNIEKLGNEPLIDRTYDNGAFSILELGR